MRDHLSWKTTHFWQKDLHFWTCHQRPPGLTDHFCGQWGGLSRQGLLCTYPSWLAVRWHLLQTVSPSHGSPRRAGPSCQIALLGHLVCLRHRCPNFDTVHVTTSQSRQRRQHVDEFGCYIHCQALMHMCFKTKNKYRLHLPAPSGILE